MKIPPAERLQIIHFPDPVLKQKAAPVGEFSSSMASLVERMFHLMREAHGVGLAAPQVGVSLRLFVCNATGEPEDDLVCINPSLSDLSGAEEGEEGCLSIPGVKVIKRRAVRATLQALDLQGQPFERRAEGLLARVWQHEVDHLDGRLITDSMSEAEEIACRRLLKQLRQEFESDR